MTSKNLVTFWQQCIDVVMRREGSKDENFIEWFSFVWLWIVGVGGLSMVFVNGWLASGIGLLWAWLCYKHLKRIF